MAVAGLALTAGCGGDERGSAGREQVVAAFYPLAFAAEQVGGNEVEVDNLTPTGAEPHDLELTPSDIGAIRDADVVLYLGEGFQPGLERAVAEREGPALDVLANEKLTASVEGGLDPHIWLDPVRFARMARAIGDELGHPDGGEELAARAEQLDAELRRGLTTCERKQIVTSHAAFGYLAARYGLVQLPLAGLSPEVEPSPRALEKLAREVERSGATTVFFESLVSPKLAQTVAREAGVETAVLDPIEGLTDAASRAGSDYFSVMRDDLAALRKALGCS